MAVFEKLYLETRSQFSHYLEFSLWFEKPSQQDGLDQYGREMFYPALGANTFQTDNFIPKNTSEACLLLALIRRSFHICVTLVR